jgi:hypothetical protein
MQKIYGIGDLLAGLTGSKFIWGGYLKKCAEDILLIHSSVLVVGTDMV